MASSIAEAKAWIKKQSRDDLTAVCVNNATESVAQTSFALRSTLDDLDSLQDIPTRMRILNPFDPLIRDRKRCLRLFDFDYRIEVFVPASKRRYGYYVFSIAA